MIEHTCYPDSFSSMMGCPACKRERADKVINDIGLTKKQATALRTPMEYLLHEAFRTGSKHPNAREIYRLIEDIPDGEWKHICDALVSDLAGHRSRK